MRDPDRVLSHPGLRALIDLSEPAAVMFSAVLHFVPDTAGPAGIVAAYRDRLAPGSYALISHATPGGMDPDLSWDAAAIYDKTARGSFSPRTPSQIAGFFTGLELVDPGLVHVAAWRPDHGALAPADTARPHILGGIGHQRGG